MPRVGAFVGDGVGVYYVDPPPDRPVPECFPSSDGLALSSLTPPYPERYGCAVRALRNVH